MGLFDFFLKRPAKTKAEKEKKIDLSTQLALMILHCDDYTRLMHNLKHDIDKMHNLFPDLTGETATQKALRQDSLIALAVNKIHEDPDLGPAAILNDQDPEHSFRLVASVLNEMNKTPRANEWAKMALKSMRSRSTSPESHEL